MTKYVYKVDYGNSAFIEKLKKYVGANVVGADCTSDCLVVIDADSLLKNDLDQYMNANGFLYLFETAKNLSALRNWGILEESDLPDENITVGDQVYCSTYKKPLWWDGTNWVDALGNALE